MQGCTNYSIAWGAGGKVQKGKDIMLIVLRLLSPIVVRNNGGKKELIVNYGRANPTQKVFS